MGAYLKAYAMRCQAAGCERTATVELMNTFNSCCGRFCAKHGKAKLVELLRDEARAPHDGRELPKGTL